MRMIKKTLCFSNGARLSVKSGQIVISMDGKSVTRPIEDIGIVILETGLISLTSALLSALIDRNVAVVTCDSHHMPNGLFMPLSSNTLQQERVEAQVKASLPLKKQLWQQTVAMKIRNQGAAIEKRKIQAGNMRTWCENVKSGDAENLEARAAAYYWKVFFPQCEGFTRDREGSFPNNLLNYGYAILRAVIARSLVGSGLMPTLGIHHCNRYNPYCLADDIMEPYRPYVDLIVLSIVEGGEYQGIINMDIKKKLLSIPVIDVMIGNLKRPLMIAASMTTASLAKCFLGESRKIVYPCL